MSKTRNCLSQFGILAGGWCVLACSVAVLQAQQPSQVEEPPARPSASDRPLLPETVVEGIPPAFPANPLEPAAVLAPGRMAMYAGRVGSAVEVITAEQIERSQRATVLEVLRGHPGVMVAQQGARGGLASIFLRGGNSAHTKVLLDGIPLNDPSNASRQFDFSNLTVDNIERIEILRGPQGVLYGSDAIGGVINIITRRGDGQPKMTMSGMGGSFGTSQTNLAMSGSNEKSYYSLAGSYLDSHGISHASAALGNTERDGYSNGTISGRFGTQLQNNLHADYVFRYSEAKAQIDDFDFFRGRPVDNLVRENLSDQFFHRIQLQKLEHEETVEHLVGFSLTDYDRRDTDPGFAPSQYLGQTRLVDYQVNVLLSELNQLTVGTSYQQEEAASDQNPLARQRNSAVYLQDHFAHGERLHTTVGVRWDEYSTAGNANTYRVASVLQLDEQGRSVHASLGTGFRAPALAENLFSFGNPDLVPERSRGWDVGIEQRLAGGAMTVDATFFRNDFRNLIVFNPNSSLGPFGALENVGRARSAGVEVSLRWLLHKKTSLTSSYTFDDAIDTTSRQQLARRPRDMLLLTLDRQLKPGASLSLQLLYVGDRRDGVQRLAEYFKLDLAGSWQLDDNWRLFARLDNLLDEQYEEVFGYGTPGFAGYAGLSWSN